MKRTGFFLILFSAGILVYFVGGYWTAIPPWARTIIKTALPLFFLLFTCLCGRVESLRQWRSVSLAFFAASCGFLVSWLISDTFLGFLGVTTSSLQGIAWTKLTESVLIVVPALLVARIGGMTNNDLFLRRGRLRAWLIVGFVAFAVFAVLFLLQAADKGIESRQLLALAPWTLIFVFANGFMEEFHFRGLLLSPFEGLLGRHGANLCIALFFTLVHAPVEYTPDIAVFLAVLFGLSLAWGYIIQKTKALWGAVLFHAGADLMIIVGIYETFGAA